LIGTYYTEDLMQKWFVKNLPAARKILKSFKSLNTILDEFRNYENKSYREIRNAVMFLCLPSITGDIRINSIQRLDTLERAINLFGILNWSPSKLNAFRSRLASEDYIQSLSAATELEVAYKLAQKLGREKVELYPTLESGGFSDVSVKINDKRIFLEIGNLGESLPEKKIQQILNASAKYLGQKINDRCYLCLNVDTAEFVFDEKGIIQVDLSIEKLNSEIDILALHKLAGFKGHFNIADMVTVIFNLELYRRIQQLLSPHTKKLLDLVNTEEIRKWLESFDLESLKKAHLVKSIIASSETTTLLVEIHPVQFFPSKAAIAERESFLNHLTRNIKSQIDEKQIQPKAPNIVLIQGFHWTLFALKDFEVLYERLQQFFKQIKDEHLSGVAVFDIDFDKTMFINNDYANSLSQLNEADINRLGFKWLKLS